MAMYTIAGTAVAKEEFKRAAKVCIGRPLDETVVSTVFHIFDVDGEHACSLLVVILLSLVFLDNL